MSSDEDIVIRLNIEGEQIGAVQALRDVKQEVGELNVFLGLSSAQWKDVHTQVRDATRGYVVVSSPIRSLSWDFMLMGRGLSILNTHLLGNNEAVKKVIGVVYIFASVLRVVTAAMDVMRAIQVANIMIQELQNAKLKERIVLEGANVAVTGTSTAVIGAQTGVLAANTTAVVTNAGAWATLRAVLGDPRGLVMLGIGAAMTTAILASFMSARSYQRGGVIPETGVYMLHKGETVVPSGMTYNQIFINMTTGGISSNVDVDNMLNKMAMRMAQESRRRLGR